MGDEDERSARPVLLIEGAGARTDGLGGRIRELGFELHVCPDLESAEAALAAGDPPIRCVLVPTGRCDRQWKRAIKALRRTGARTGAELVALGPEPERAERKLLRSAGFRYSLWEPVSDAALRFQLNRLTRVNADDEIRAARRVPTALAARATAGGRSRDASVYSLSESGAFLETRRACMSGARVDVELLLPDRTLRVPGVVAFANVPGNLQRPNLPLGMGVRFDDLESETRSALVDYVESQLAQLAV